LANAYAPLQVSTPEATAFDLIRYAARIGGIGRAAETIAPLLPLMRPAELRRVLKIEDEPATAQRLGFVLEKLRQPTWPRSFKIGCRRISFVPLVPGGRGSAPEIKRWRILNNAGEFER
jgi:predicted transcriptional regulator of viral defense system